MFGLGCKLLGKNSGLKPFKVMVSYEWQPFWMKRRRSEELCFEIDVRPYRGLIPIRENNEIAEVLKEYLPQIATSFDQKGI